MKFSQKKLFFLPVSIAKQKRIILKAVFTATTTDNKLDNSFKRNYTAIRCVQRKTTETIDRNV